MQLSVDSPLSRAGFTRDQSGSVYRLNDHRAEDSQTVVVEFGWIRRETVCIVIPSEVAQV
jgi:hypothetical protein